MLARARRRIDGVSDPGVGEAIYLRDPDHYSNLVQVAALELAGA